MPNIRPSNSISIYSPNKKKNLTFNQLHNTKYSKSQNSMFEVRSLETRIFNKIYPTKDEENTRRGRENHKCNTEVMH